MNSPLPPDPYKILGVAKDAKLPEIRSAHRKLVLKCHPDKVQDAALKAAKQDEFQKVQQAYEILSDDAKRSKYDDQLKLHELRAEMSRGNPTPRSNPFEYEVKTASPRANSYARTAPKVYSQTVPPRSHEDLYDEPIRHAPKKSTSYESATDRDRKQRPSARDEERTREAMRRYAEEEKIKAAILAEKLSKERERERSARSHSDKKKSRDKDRRRGTEEKTRRHAYVEGDSSEDEKLVAAMRSAERRQRAVEEEEARLEQARLVAEAQQRAQAQAQIKEAPLSEKWDDHRNQAAEYMAQAARSRRAPAAEEHHTPPPLRRAETYQPQPSPQYNVRYATVPQQQYSEDDTARRSSAHKESRRSSDTPSKREKSRRRSPEHPMDSYANIVEPPSPSPSFVPRMPSLQKQTSAPPQLSRDKPSRSRTQDYPTTRQDTVPPLPRSQTFTGDIRDRGRERGGSRLKNEYESGESDLDSPKYTARVSHSPRRTGPEPMVYRVSEGRSHPVPSRSHRSDLRDLNEGSYQRHRSPSPRSTPTRHDPRPPITRSPPSNDYTNGEYRTAPNQYYPAPEAPLLTKPVIVPATRPKLAREGSGSGRSHSQRIPQNATYSSVKFRPTYDPSQVKTADYPAAQFYTSGPQTDGRDYYSSHRSREQPMYA